ncbi:MAG: hypothetical protein PHU44_06495 [Syntrophales bacterium]|nr:hypothetical protein [Syntrophales bacterium]MDD5642012.1 hypothetical protein [Syntrophales bacterium]
MAETSLKQDFVERYQDVDRIWSGHSFLAYMDGLKALLAELPESAAAIPTKEYHYQMAGNLDFVYGEMLYSLSGTEGLLRDKAFPLLECYIKPLLSPSVALECGIRYRTKEGEEKTRTCEVVRTDVTGYILFTDYHRPL